VNVTVRVGDVAAPDGWPRNSVCCGGLRRLQMGSAMSEDFLRLVRFGDGNRIELIEWIEPYNPAESGAARLD